MALGNRLEYFVLIAFDLKLLNAEEHRILTEEVVEVRKMLAGFSKRLAVSNSF
jgi:hypothetical protein